MRAFLAFDLEDLDKEKIKKILNKKIKNLKKLNQLEEKKNLKKVQSKHYHITFLFFSNLSQENLAKIRKLFKEKIYFKEFDVITEGIEVFTNRKGEVRVIYLKINSEELNKFINIYKKIIKELNLSFEEELQLKNLKPHITLFRLKKPVNYNSIKDELNEIEKEIKNLKLKITDFCLFESILKPTGPIYNKIISTKNFTTK